MQYSYHVGSVHQDTLDIVEDTNHRQVEETDGFLRSEGAPQVRNVVHNVQSVQMLRKKVILSQDAVQRLPCCEGDEDLVLACHDGQARVSPGCEVHKQWCDVISIFRPPARRSVRKPISPNENRKSKIAK